MCAHSCRREAQGLGQRGSPLCGAAQAAFPEYKSQQPQPQPAETAVSAGPGCRVLPLTRRTVLSTSSRPPAASTCPFLVYVSLFLLQKASLWKQLLFVNRGRAEADPSTSWPSEGQTQAWRCLRPHCAGTCIRLASLMIASSPQRQMQEGGRGCFLKGERTEGWGGPAKQPSRAGTVSCTTQTHSMSCKDVLTRQRAAGAASFPRSCFWGPRCVLHTGLNSPGGRGWS